MFKHSFKVLFLLVATCALQASIPGPSYGNSMLAKPQFAKQVIVHNRPLAKVHGKVFSVLDVQKSMDRYLRKSYPEIVDEPEAVLQFYVHNWRPILQEMVDNELMLMEAEELSYNIDKQYVREEMSERFGGNTNEGIEQSGLSPTEAQEKVQNDLICKSMMWYRVWQRSINEVTPQIVHDHYIAQLKDNPSQEEWTYQMCTIRGKDSDATSKLAADVQKLFKKTNSNLGSALADAVAAISAISPSEVSVKLSEDIKLTSQELSKENLSILGNLNPMEISNPVSQTSRYDDQTVTRLFHLKDHTIKQPPAFETVSDQIHDGLVGKRSEGIRKAYMDRLRKRYCCRDLIIEKMYGTETILFTLHG